MPTITNFGDIVATGNALIQGTLSVLGTAATLTGNLLPAVAGTSGIGLIGTPFGSASIGLINAATLNVTTQVYATNIFSPLANITTLNATSITSVTGFLGSLYGTIVGQNAASVSLLTASQNVYAPTMNAQTMNAVQTVIASNLIARSNIYTSGYLYASNISASNIQGVVQVTSVNGLAGGTITSDVTVQGTLNAVQFGGTAIQQTVQGSGSASQAMSTALG